jgi:MoaA/NifB/PqqE/SkfB family radical SAM enzyme
MNRNKFVGWKDYQTFAGGSWPTYQEFIAGANATDPAIQQEIDQFIQMMQENYRALFPDINALADANATRQQHQFHNKNHVPNGCRIPWNVMGINANGHVYICSSPSWIPKFVGNIVEADNVWQVLNSETAQKIRQEIYHGRYYYCNNKLCSFFGAVESNKYNFAASNAADLLPMQFEPRPEYQVTEIPYSLAFDFDYTCNFQCPSCRTQVINNNKHHVIRPINDEIVNSIKTKIIDEINNQPVNICWAGGEIFISEPYLNLFEYIINKKKSNITHSVSTNGSYLLKKKHMVMSMLPHISMLRISFDAATAETYSKIRVGGQWETLIENVQWLSEYVKQQRLTVKLVADFVVQQQNYKEIPMFVELANSLGIKDINFQKMWNWGTWPMEQFKQHNIYDREHPEYNALVEILRSVGRNVVQ